MIPVPRHSFPTRRSSDLVQAYGASRSLFTQGYKYMFAILSTSELYLASTISLLAEQAEAMGKKPADVKVAMAFENDPFSLDVRAGVVEDVKKFGMKHRKSVL